MKKKKWMMLSLILPGFVLFIVAGGAIVQLLWNWLLPEILSARPISFWQALGLLALCRILFGGFGSRGRHRGWGAWSARERCRPAGGVASPMVGDI